MAQKKGLDKTLIEGLKRLFEPIHRRKKVLTFHINRDAQVLVTLRHGTNPITLSWESQGDLTITTLRSYSTMELKTSSGDVKLIIPNTEIVKWLIGLGEPKQG